MNYPSITVLEFNSSCPSFSEEQLNSIRNSPALICLSPSSDYWSKKNGLRYSAVDDFINPALLREEGNSNYEVIEKTCHILNDIILEANSFSQVFSNPNPDPIYGNYYKMKVIYDSLFIRRQVVSSILRLYKPGAVNLYTDFLIGAGDLEETVFFNSGSIYYLILKTLTNDYGYALNINLLPDCSRRKISRKITPAKIVSLIISLFKSQHFSSGRNAILALSLFSDWDEPLQQLAYSGQAKLFCLSSSGVKIKSYSRINYLWGIVKQHIPWRAQPPEEKEQRAHEKFFLKKLYDRKNSFPISDVFFSLMQPYFLRILKDTFKLYKESFQSIKKQLTAKQISVVTSCFITDPKHFMVTKAARELGIPVCIFQHGGVGFDTHPMYYWGDILPADNLFLYGEEVKEYYKKISGTKQLNYFVTGSPLIDALKKQRASSAGKMNKIKTCVYLLNILAGNTHYLGHKNYLSDISLWLIQKGVVDIFSRQKGWRLIIKPHPALHVLSNPLGDYIRDNRIRNVEINSNVNLTKLLNACELVILDYPATALIQSMALRKSLIVYSGFFTIEKSLQERLKNIIGVYDNKDDFLKNIESLLKNGDLFRDKLNYDGFLSGYATHKNDGNSTSRIKKILFEMMEGKTAEENF